MAKRVTEEDIENINILYLEYKTYAEVARRTGFSPSTVKKYVIKDFIPKEKIQIVKFDKSTNELMPNLSFPTDKEQWQQLFEMTEEEKQECEELRKEILI